MSDLSPYRFFPQYCRLIQNDPDVLIFYFPTVMTATGLNVLESLLSIDIVTWVRVPAWANFYQPFNFSVNDYSEYQNTVCFFLFSN